MLSARLAYRYAALLLCAALVACGVAGADDVAALGARVRQLEDREAIRALLLAYGRALDRRDFEAFAALFAETDGEWVGGFGAARGRAAIFEMMDRNIGHVPGGSPGNTFHLFTNESIGVNGDRASAVTKWVFVVADDGNAPRWLYLGHYDDSFVRESGEWKFLRREAYTDLPVQR